jgi:hypothetical protein
MTTPSPSINNGGEKDNHTPPPVTGALTLTTEGTIATNVQAIGEQVVVLHEGPQLSVKTPPINAPAIQVAREVVGAIGQVPKIPDITPLSPSNDSLSEGGEYANSEFFAGGTSTLQIGGSRVLPQPATILSEHLKRKGENDNTHSGMTDEEEEVDARMSSLSTGNGTTLSKRKDKDVVAPLETNAFTKFNPSLNEENFIEDDEGVGDISTGEGVVESPNKKRAVLLEPSVMDDPNIPFQ